MFWRVIYLDKTVIYLKMAKRPISSQNCHFECTCNNKRHEELKVFISHLSSLCQQNAIFDVIIQCGFDENPDETIFDFIGKWFGIDYNSLKQIINDLTFDVYKKQKIDVDVDVDQQPKNMNMFSIPPSINKPITKFHHLLINQSPNHLKDLFHQYRIFHSTHFNLHLILIFHLEQLHLNF